MLRIRTAFVCAAALVAMTALPASAQWGSGHTSFEGATHEMQKRGPQSDIVGPDWGGRYIVTEPGYRTGYRTYRRPHYPPAYGYYPPPNARYGFPR